MRGSRRDDPAGDAGVLSDAEDASTISARSWPARSCRRSASNTISIRRGSRTMTCSVQADAKARIGIHSDVIAVRSADRQDAQEDRGHVRSDRRPLRSAEHRAQRRHGSLLARARRAIARAHRTRTRARCVHGDRRRGARAGAARTCGVGRRHRLFGGDAAARPREGEGARGGARARSA